MNPLAPLARPSLATLWAGHLLSATGSEFYAVAVVWTATGLSEVEWASPRDLA